MTPWTHIILSAVLITIGSVWQAYGWYLKSESKSKIQSPQSHSGVGDNVAGNKYETTIIYDKNGYKQGIPQGPAISSVPANKEFISRTPHDLLALYKTALNPIQVDDALSSFKGKWVKAEGQIVGMIAGLPNGDQAGITLKHNGDVMDCRFGPQWKNDLLSLSVGDFLKVNGKIGPTQNHSQLYLVECELLK